MNMATDEEIDSFVAQNRELIERMMRIQKESFDEIEAADESARSVKDAARLVREKSEEFFRNTYITITSPEVQKHFMTASMEFLAGLNAIADAAPLPDYVKEGMDNVRKAGRQASCRVNTDCPNKVRRESGQEESAE